MSRWTRKNALATLADVAAVVVWSRAISIVTTSEPIGSVPKTDYVVLINVGGAPILPTAVGNMNMYTFKNKTAGNVTVATTSAQTIDGSTTAVLGPSDSIDVVSDNTNWNVI